MLCVGDYKVSNFPWTNPQHFNVPKQLPTDLGHSNKYQTLNLYKNLKRQISEEKYNKRRQKCSHYRMILAGYKWRWYTTLGTAAANHCQTMYTVQGHRLLQKYVKACIQQVSVLPKFLSSILFETTVRSLQFLPEENFLFILLMKN